eukprot:c8490_g1_i1 orf=92-310(+)
MEFNLPRHYCVFLMQCHQQLFKLMYHKLTGSPEVLRSSRAELRPAALIGETFQVHMWQHQALGGDYPYIKGP